jgi:hypothetical protein
MVTPAYEESFEVACLLATCKGFRVERGVGARGVGARGVGT